MPGRRLRPRLLRFESPHGPALRLKLLSQILALGRGEPGLQLRLELVRPLCRQVVPVRAGVIGRKARDQGEAAHGGGGLLGLLPADVPLGFAVGAGLALLVVVVVAGDDEALVRITLTESSRYGFEVSGGEGDDDGQARGLMQASRRWRSPRR